MLCIRPNSRHDEDHVSPARCLHLLGLGAVVIAPPHAAPFFPKRQIPMNSASDPGVKSAGVASAGRQDRLFMAPGFRSSRDLLRCLRRRGQDAPATAALGRQRRFGLGAPIAAVSGRSATFKLTHYRMAGSVGRNVITMVSSATPGGSTEPGFVTGSRP